MSETNGQEPSPAAPGAVPIGPVPTMVAVMPIGQARQVALLFSTPQGQSWFFVNAEAADGLAESLRAASHKVRLGLIAPPPPTIITPPGT